MLRKSPNNWVFHSDQMTPWANQGHIIRDGAEKGAKEGYHDCRDCFSTPSSSSAPSSDLHISTPLRHPFIPLQQPLPFALDISAFDRFLALFTFFNKKNIPPEHTLDITSSTIPRTSPGTNLCTTPSNTPSAYLTQWRVQWGWGQ